LLDGIQCPRPGIVVVAAGHECGTSDRGYVVHDEVPTPPVCPVCAGCSSAD
jgi:hypothetical protein